MWEFSTNDRRSALGETYAKSLLLSVSSPNSCSNPWISGHILELHSFKPYLFSCCAKLYIRQPAQLPPSPERY